MKPNYIYKTDEATRAYHLEYYYGHRKLGKRSKLTIKKICNLCGNSYKARAKTQKYCSNCGQIHAQTYGRAYYKKRQQEQYKQTKRWEIFNRDNFTCQYCGRNPTEDNVKLHLDHIKPKIDGGTDGRENLVTACDQCNVEKGTKCLRNEVAFKERL